MSCQPAVRSTLQSLAKARKYSSLEDYYNFTYSDLKRAGGAVRRLVERAGFVSLVLAAFPAHSWQVWRFPKAPTGWWQDITNQREYLSDFAERNNIRQSEDWYQVQTADLVSQHGTVCLALCFSGLANQFYSQALPYFIYTMIQCTMWSSLCIPNTTGRPGNFLN